MNIYRYSFQCDCLVGGKTITYTLEIRTDAIIYAEKLMEFKVKSPAIQENIADSLYAEFGGQQTLTARHGSVDIETRRGSL